MKKIIVITLLFTIITSGSLFAQESQKHDSTSYKFLKNELGVNIAPLIGSALGGNMMSPQYSICYKRLVKGGNALRINAAVQLYYKDQLLTSSPNFPDNYELVSQSSTSEIRRYSESKQAPKFQLGIGYEWRKGTHRLSRFYGVDLIGGRMNRSYTKKDYFMVLDSNSTPISKGPSWIIDPNNNKPSTAFDSHTNSFFLGLSPFYGIRYPITKRLIVTAQAGFDLTAAFGNYETNDYANGIHLSGMVTSFNFDTRGFISELNLSYRF